MEEELFPVVKGCPQCFIHWDEFRKEKSDKMIFEKCDYCESHPNMSSKELLLRQLDIIEKAYIYTFPHVLRHLIKHIDLKD